MNAEAVTHRDALPSRTCAADHHRQPAAAAPRGTHDRWPTLPPPRRPVDRSLSASESTGSLLWQLAAIAVAAFVIRLVPVLLTGGLHGIIDYDDSVYMGAALAFVDGRIPYRDFALLHPPGIVYAAHPVRRAQLAHVRRDGIRRRPGRLHGAWRGQHVPRRPRRVRAVARRARRRAAVRRLDRRRAGRAVDVADRPPERASAARAAGPDLPPVQHRRGRR